MAHDAQLPLPWNQVDDETIRLACLMKQFALPYQSLLVWMWTSNYHSYEGSVSEQIDA